MDGATQARVADAIERLGRLPVLDGTVQRVLVLSEDPDATTGDLVDVLESDATFSANLLRYANSAHCARPIRVRTIRQAVTLVGRRAVARLSLEAATCRFLERTPGNGRISRGQMHVHASSVSACATALAEHAGAAVDTVHLAGLLHDVGKLVLPLAFGEEVLDTLALAHPGGAARAQAEVERLGVDHAAAGAMLARASGVDSDVADAIAMHHGGPRGITVPSREAACVQIGNSVANLMNGIDADHELIDAALQVLELPHEVLDQIAERAVNPGAPSRPTAIAERVADLERLARTDDLTGLSNRRHWLMSVRGELAESGSGGVLIIDADHFKQINDVHGHATGDLVLTEVARVVSRHGVAGRLGGDEFAVFVPGDGSAAFAAAEQIVSDVSTSFAPNGHPGLEVGVSVGVATAPMHGTDLAALLEHADQALYEAKAGGRNRAAQAA